MNYINVGARIDGQRPKTKKALKAAMTNNPETIVFDVTSAFHTGPMFYRVNELPEGYSLSVAGPDPYNNRLWFATVTDRGTVK